MKAEVASELASVFDRIAARLSRCLFWLAPQADVQSASASLELRQTAKDMSKDSLKKSCDALAEDAHLLLLLLICWCPAAQ